MNDNEIQIRITGTHGELKSTLAAAVSSAKDAAGEIKSSFTKAGEGASTSFKAMKADISKVSSEMSEMARTSTSAATASARAWLQADAAIEKLAKAQAEASREVKAAKAAYESGRSSLEEYNASLLRTKAALNMVENEHRQAMSELRKSPPAQGPGIGGGPPVGSIGSLKGTLQGIGIAVGINEMLQLGTATVRSAAEFERLRSVLETLEGGKGGANARFADLKKFATETPYELSEVVTAFARLKAQGLDPSNAALRSYGNTASAMGKSITQIIEAASDAVMGENERLKEFGIKARDNGNTVIFTFKGISTEVKKTSADIQAYLLNIGNTDFAGAMERQMKTLGGAFSNLKDAAANFADEVGQGGLSAAIRDVITEMTGAAGASGSLAKELGGVLGETIRAVADIVKTFGGVVGEVFNTVKQIVGDVFGKSAGDAFTFGNILKAVSMIVRAFGDTIRAVFTIIGTAVQTGINAFTTFADVVRKAMVFDFSGALAALQSGINREVEIVREGADRIRKIRADAANAGVRIRQGDGSWGITSNVSDWMAPSAPAGGLAVPGGASPRTGGTGRSRTGGAGGSKAETTRTGEWRDELQDKLLDEEKAGRETLSFTEKFWREKLALARKGSKEEKEINRELIRTQISLAREKSQEDIAALRHFEELDRSAAENEVELARMVLDEKLSLIDEEENAGHISALQAIRDRAQVNQEIIRLEKELETKLYSIKLGSLTMQRSQYARGTAQYREYTRQIEQIETQHQQRMRQIDAQGQKLQTAADRQASLERTRLQRTAIQQISQSWASTLSQMLTLQMSFSEGIRGLWQGVQQMIANALATVIQNWLTQKLTSMIMGKAIDQAAGAGQIAANAAIAGSAAYASTAAIPIVGPALAPAAAATAYGATMAFQGLLAAGNSFDVGAWNLSQDQFAKVHAGEMIIPPEMAGGMRNLFRAVGGSNDNGSSARFGGFGQTSNNFHIHAMDAKDVRRLFMDHKGPIAEALRKYARDGGR